MPLDDLPIPKDDNRGTKFGLAQMAAGVPDVTAFLFGNKKAKDPNDVSKGKLKKYTRRGEFQALQTAREIADREYTPYEGERIAPMSGNEQAAYNLAGANAGPNSQSARLMGKAEDTLDASNMEFNDANLARYTNPYAKQVKDIAIRDANEAFEDQRSDLRSGLAASDAFGTDRGALLESELNKGHERNVGDISVKTMSDAFDKGSALFMQDSARRQSAAQAYQQLGSDVTRMNSQQISDLVATGGLDRLLRQAELDVDYEAFIEERDWDVTNLQPLLQTLSVLNKSPSTQGEDKKKSSPWSSILGVVGTAVGAFYGGPAGAQAGGAIGSGIGGAIG
jgi:hypothetical protein